MLASEGAADVVAPRGGVALVSLKDPCEGVNAVPAPLTAVVEPTSMTWLALVLAAERAGGQMEMIGARRFSRLRGAIMGKNKSDVIDSDGYVNVIQDHTRTA